MQDMLRVIARQPKCLKRGRFIWLGNKSDIRARQKDLFAKSDVPDQLA